MASAGIPEPDLSHEERALLDKGVAEFNHGHFFECHDTLEELWSGVRGPGRDFFQGLIQVAVAFYHLDGGNLPGADSMFARALTRLAAYPDRYFGFDLAAQRAEIERWRARIAHGTLAEAGAQEMPRWTFAHP
jgi:predicted metal-dependent hydrolase